MAGFTYYRPGSSPVSSLEEVAQLRLAYAFDSPPANQQVSQGPDGQLGVTFARTASDCGYHPDAQQWRKVPHSDAWAGFTVDARPTPQDLQRPKMVSGHPVTFSDGSVWQIPAAQRYGEVNGELAIDRNLPASYRLGEDGRWERGGVIARYARLWELTCQMQEAFGDGDSSQLEYEDELAMLAISANYYAADCEMDLLGLYDQQSWDGIILALIDYPTLQKWEEQKKTDESPITPDGGSSHSGPGSATQGPLVITTPPLPT